MTETMLVTDMTYRGKVTSITPAAKDFKGKDGKKRYCHLLLIEVDGFPGIYKAQICNELKGISDFEVYDKIVFQVVTHFMGEDIYTIKFKNKIFVPEQRVKLSPDPEPEAESKPSAPKLERQYASSIAGTPWSICLTAAKDFHKDRKTAKDEDVIKTLKSYLISYNEYLEDENAYLNKQ